MDKLSWLSPLSLEWAGLIMVLRAVNMSLDTLRVLAVMRHRKLVSWVYGLVQVSIFFFITAWVLADLGNPLKVLGYCAGFAAGNAIGMWLEEKIAQGYTDLQIVSTRRGLRLEAMLRERGYAVTLVSGHGRDGVVDVLTCSVRRKHAQEVIAMILAEDNQSFISSSEVRRIGGGFWGML